MTFDADLAARTVGFTAAGDDGVLTWHAGAAFDATGHPDASRPGSAIRRTIRSRCRCSRARCAPSCCGRARRPCRCGLRSTSTASAGAAAAALPAEALRLLLEGLRSIDSQVGTALEDLASALGMLRAPDDRGFRAIVAPVALFSDPAGWLRQAGVLSTVSGGPLDVGKVTDLLEAVKPFVGLAGTPRGVWPIADGVQLAVTAAGAGPTVVARRSTPRRGWPGWPGIHRSPRASPRG